jgi:hypothetical protein
MIFLLSFNYTNKTGELLKDERDRGRGSEFKK